MSRTTVQVNTAQIWIVSNGTQRSFIINADGTVVAPNNISIQYSGQSYKGVFATAAITTADKTYTFPNRTGNVALEDSTSLNAMLPSQTGNGGKSLFTDGTAAYWGAAATSSLTTLNGINCTTYAAQTFAIGTTGTAPNWVSTNSNTNTHTLHIPMASATGVTAGLLSKADYDRIAFKDAINTFSAQQTFTNAPIITNTSTATNAVATYGQVLAARNGIGLRPPVDALDTVTTAASLADITTVDGQTVTSGMRVLATALSSGAGKVYKCTGTGPTTWSLETDGQAGDGSATDGDIIFVKAGTNYHDQQWAYNGTSWILYNVSQSWTFSTGLSVSGTTVTVAYGATGTTACVGNDARLSNSRTPTAHQLDSATYHTISDKTAGQVLIATSATTFGFITFSGDISTITAAGVVTINKISGVSINDLGIQQNVAILSDNISSAILVTGCSWAVATYRSVRIEFSLSRGSGNYSVGTIYLLYDGTTAQITIEEDLYVGTHGIVFTADVNGGNMRLLYTSSSTGTTAQFRFNNKTFAI